MFPNKPRRKTIFETIHSTALRKILHINRDHFPQKTATSQVGKVFSFLLFILQGKGWSRSKGKINVLVLHIHENSTRILSPTKIAFLKLERYGHNYFDSQKLGKSQIIDKHNFSRLKFKTSRSNTAGIFFFLHFSKTAF